MPCAGPPWILGWRGAPLEAPENTIASFLRALNAGVDGLHYDLRACMSGDALVMRDARLERTTDGVGELAGLTVPEIFSLDAGGWLSKEFAGERVPHLDDVLDLHATRSDAPLHLVELHDFELADGLMNRLRSIHPPISMRVATSRRDGCLALRDAGLAVLLVAEEAEEDDLAFVRDERLEGLALTAPRGWRTEAGRLTWPCERWILGISSAPDLFEAFRDGVNGVTTSEPRRALALRCLAGLGASDSRYAPIAVEPLGISTASNGETAGEWSGEWSPSVQLCNPFDFPCRVTTQLYVRRGAFDCEGLPRSLELEPGARETLHFRLRGGSWSPGGDPVCAALFEWGEGPGRPAGSLMFDTSLRRERVVLADVITQRLEMLRESPGVVPASMTLRRRGGRLALRVENPGGMRQPRCVARLGGRDYFGGIGLQLPLPEDFDLRTEGVEFSCGFYGQNGSGSAEGLRRWSGGLPSDPGHGGAGRLLARRFA